MVKWKISLTGNILLQGDGFFISFNPNPIIMPDTRGGETALVVEGGESPNVISGNTYYILNGDFRKQYEKLLPKGLKACRKFYDSKKGEFDSSWSGK